MIDNTINSDGTDVFLLTKPAGSNSIQRPVRRLPDSVIAASLYLGKLAGLEWNVSTFYIASRSLLLLVGETDINFLKIHNIKNYLL